MFPIKVLAQNPITNPISSAFSSVEAIITSLSSFVLPVATLAFLAMIIYGGFTKLTSAGNQEAEQKANKILQYAIIGYIIIIIAPVIIGLIGALLGVELIGS